MDELVQWLTAQLDEDERIALAAARLRTGSLDKKWVNEHHVVWPSKVGLNEPSITHDPPAADADPAVKEVGACRAVHVAEWDPDRVLREIEADRTLLARYERAAGEYPAGGGAYDYDSGVGREETVTLEWVVRLRAARYSHRPGYRPEWAPTE